MFTGTGIKITAEGKHRVGSLLESDTFCEKYASDKMKNWYDEIERQSEFAKPQPQAAYAFMHGVRGK